MRPILWKWDDNAGGYQGGSAVRGVGDSEEGIRSCHESRYGAILIEPVVKSRCIIEVGNVDILAV